MRLAVAAAVAGAVLAVDAQAQQSGTAAKRKSSSAAASSGFSSPAFAAAGPAQKQKQRPGSKAATPAAKQPAAGPPTRPAVKPAAKETTPSLEQLLATALKNNAEILVAEAKLRQAQAELKRTRTDVLRAVVEHFHALKAQELAVKQAEARLPNLESLSRAARQAYRAGKADQAEALQAEQAAKEAQTALVEAKAKLEVLRQTLSFLVGTGPELAGTMQATISGMPATGVGIELRRYPRTAPTGGASGASMTSAPQMTLSVPQEKVQWSPGFEAFEAQPMRMTISAMPGSPPPHGAFGSPSRRPGASGVAAGLDPKMRERVLNALNQPISVDFVDTPLLDVIDFLHQKAGIPFVVSPQVPDELKVTLELKDVPLGAVIQAIEDIAYVQFVARDYGILVEQAGFGVFGGGYGEAAPLGKLWREAVKESPQPAKPKAK